MIDRLSDEKKITVLHNHRDWLNLTENWIYNQIHYLPIEIENHIVCEEVKNLDRFRLANIHNFSDSPSWHRFIDLNLRKLKVHKHLGFCTRVAKNIRADILHSHYGNQAWRNIAVAKRAKLKHIVTFYGYDVNFLPNSFPKWHQRYLDLFKHINCVLCEGSYMAQCIANLGCPKSKIHVHHLGIAVEEIEFKPRVWNISEPLKVLIAATFREKKGIPYALEALGKLQHKIPLEITIIGDASPDPRSQSEKQKILTAIETCNLQSKISMLGCQPHTRLLEEAYKHHIFISPSVTSNDGDTEGGAPVAIIEMVASGMPVVSTKHCDIPEVTKNNVRNLLAAERDVDGLVSHLKWLIDHPMQWRKMLEAGREHIEQEYDARKQGASLAKIYQSMSN